MTPAVRLAGALLLPLASLSFLVARPAAPSRKKFAKLDYARDIQPILQARCFSCHGPKKQRGDLRLDRKADALRGGQSGPAIVPGKSGVSLLLRRARSEQKKEQMPPSGERLTAKELRALADWIDQGAPWDDKGAIDPRETHWAFQPVQRPAVPDAGQSWARNPIDRFLAARLDKAGLTPSPEAERATLIRRVTFDLTGLPPAPEEVRAYVADRRPDAYERVVDRLLASPQYGERWARHWLDVVRFAESHGFETNAARPNAWPFRDWVIRALNEDRSYDRFLRAQLAGDAENEGEATGFLVGGAFDQVKGDPTLTAQQRADELHDMVSTTGAAFFGLTVGCARCHDHKFDPISHFDYHGLKAIFAGVQHGERSIAFGDAAHRAQLAEATRRELAAIETKLAPLEARAGEVLRLDASSGQELVRRSRDLAYPTGRGRGESGDVGGEKQLPTLSEGCRMWEKGERREVIAWSPRIRGRFRVWLSWGCATGLARGARYVLETKGERTEVARVDQRAFADGTAAVGRRPLWSGLFDAGVHELTAESRILLQGDGVGAITADVLFLERVGANEKGKSSLPWPPLRPAVNPVKNVERFAPVEARHLRITILATANGDEPCIDELEVFAEGKNVALASHGTTTRSGGNYPGVTIHKLAHINDGRYGNSWSWISNRRGQGWVELKLPKAVSIDRVVWGRDRDRVFRDRLATRYRIEVATHPGTWRTVASAEDRLPVGAALTMPATRRSLNEEGIKAHRELQRRQRELEARLALQGAAPLVYAGRFTAPEPTHRLKRGEVTARGERVAPGMLEKFPQRVALAMDAPEQARRVALAKWVTSPAHPLTARVIVNRLWQHHFGTGLVATPSDFGLNGARPSHPELLDWLADELVRGGWSLKHVHRLILLSSAYRQSSAATTKGLAADAGSRLLWRYPPRRLEAEAIRDSILAASGRLDRAMGGPGFDLFEARGNTSQGVKIYVPKQSFTRAEWRRMIYQSKPRMRLDDTFGAFDCPDAGQAAPTRTTSTTALQALNLLNSPFLHQQARYFAERLRREGGAPEGQVRRAYWLALGREPEADELTDAVSLARGHGLQALCLGLFNTSEFLHVD